MATKEALIGRAVVASQLSRAFRLRSFVSNLQRFTPVDEDGDFVVIPVDASESAAILLHRLDRLEGPRFAVATILDGDLHVRSFHRAPVVSSAESVQGGATVGDLFRRILANRDSVFVLDGMEFQAALSEGALVSSP